MSNDDDKEVVRRAVEVGRSNLSSYHILRNNLCVNARQAAEARVNKLFTGPAEVVDTPPVGNEVTISDSC